MSAGISAQPAREAPQDLVGRGCPGLGVGRFPDLPGRDRGSRHPAVQADQVGGVGPHELAERISGQLTVELIGHGQQDEVRLAGRGDGIDRVEVDAGAGDARLGGHAAAGDQPADVHGLAVAARALELEHAALIVPEQGLEGLAAGRGEQERRGAVPLVGPQAAALDVGLIVRADRVHLRVHRGHPAEHADQEPAPDQVEALIRRGVKLLPLLHPLPRGGEQAQADQLGLICIRLLRQALGQALAQRGQVRGDGTGRLPVPPRAQEHAAHVVPDPVPAGPVPDLEDERIAKQAGQRGVPGGPGLDGDRVDELVIEAGQRGQVGEQAPLGGRQQRHGQLEQGGVRGHGGGQVAHGSHSDSNCPALALRSKISK